METQPLIIVAVTSILGVITGVASALVSQWAYARLKEKRDLRRRFKTIKANIRHTQLVSSLRSHLSQLRQLFLENDDELLETHPGNREFFEEWLDEQSITIGIQRWDQPRIKKLCADLDKLKV